MIGFHIHTYLHCSFFLFLSVTLRISCNLIAFSQSMLLRRVLVAKRFTWEDVSDSGS